MKNPYHRRYLWGALALSALLLTACAELLTLTREVGVPTFMTFARSLIKTTSANYIPDYQDNVTALLNALDSRTGSKSPRLGNNIELVNLNNAALIDSDSEPNVVREKDQLRLNVALLKQVDSAGSVYSVPIKDGDTLTSDIEIENSDRLKIFCSTEEDCYVYIIWIDGSGWVQPIFPGPFSEFDNPLPAGSELLIPGEDQAFALDEMRGIETVFFIASRTPRTDLEQLIEKFADWERPETRQREELSTPPMVLPRDVSSQPGPQATIRTRGGDITIDTTTFLTLHSDTDLMVSRWFHHR